MTLTAPLITFRDKNANALSSINFAQSTLGSDFLPVLQGENSIPVTVRVYNNYGLSSNIASAINVNVTIYDGVGSASHTSTKPVVAQAWIRVYETGFGESTGAPGLYTAYTGTDTAIGGTNIYSPLVGSDGSLNDYIRAGADTNSLGFVEFALYAQLPQGIASQTCNFAFSISYEWIT